MKKIIWIVLIFILLINVAESFTFEPQVRKINLSLGSLRDVMDMNYRYELKEGDVWDCDEGVKYIERSNILVNYRSKVKTCIVISV